MRSDLGSEGAKGARGAALAQSDRRFNMVNGMEISVPCSAGNLIDQITILAIKKSRIAEEEKREKVSRELDVLSRIRVNIPQLNTPLVLRLEQSLSEVNGILWDVEDELRAMEARKEFGERFIMAARSVYQTNDRRAELKSYIDRIVGSTFSEQKWFSGP